MTLVKLSFGTIAPVFAGSMFYGIIISGFGLFSSAMVDNLCFTFVAIMSSIVFEN